MATIKQEKTDISEVKERIVALCRDIPKGITNAVIQNDMPQVPAKQSALAINELLSQGKIVLLTTADGQIRYQVKDASAAKVKGADHEERMVYKVIEESKNKGIWNREIRYRTNISLTSLNKVLKNLESKKLIKAVKSVAQSKKKVYMLYNLEPDRSVTGGAWYSDQEFESEFVDVLNQQCFKFLEQKATVAKETIPDPMGQRNGSFAPSRDVWKYITDLKISKVPLSVEEIETILDTLIYDGKVESSIVSGGEGGAQQIKLYRAVMSLIPTTGLMRTPCGVCPVFSDCHEGGEVSPSKCIYMKEWLDF